MRSAHLVIALIAVGCVLLAVGIGFAEQSNFTLAPQQSVAVGHYTVTYVGLTKGGWPAYTLYLQGGGRIAALALATEAVATELQFAEKRSHTNVVAAGVGGLRNQTSGSITISGVSGTVTKAYLYWQGPTNSTSPTVNSSITINGTLVVGS